jgi:hypothetical protein
MFWLYILIVAVLFVAAVGWLCRPRGSARGAPTADLDTNVRRERWRTQGRTEEFPG